MKEGFTVTTLKEGCPPGAQNRPKQGRTDPLPAAILTTKYSKRKPIDQAKLESQLRRIARAIAFRNAAPPAPTPDGGVVFQP